MSTERAKVIENVQEFLAVLSHELRNPLAAAMNGVQVLRQTGR